MCVDFIISKVKSAQAPIDKIVWLNNDLLSNAVCVCVCVWNCPSIRLTTITEFRFLCQCRVIFFCLTPFFFLLSIDIAFCLSFKFCTADDQSCFECPQKNKSHRHFVDVVFAAVVWHVSDLMFRLCQYLSMSYHDVVSESEGESEWEEGDGWAIACVCDMKKKNVTDTGIAIEKCVCVCKCLQKKSAEIAKPTNCKAISQMSRRQCQCD